MKRIVSVLSLIIALVMLSGCAVKNDLSAVPSGIQTEVATESDASTVEEDVAEDTSAEDAPEESVTVEALFEELTQENPVAEEEIAEEPVVEEEIEEEPVETIVYTAERE